MNRIFIFTGAGLDAPSGIKTFRDSNGLWNNHNVEDVCSEHTWLRNYDLIHDFYNQRREQLKDVVPNIAHHLIKELQDKYRMINITMNVSDLLDRVGVRNLKLHGDLTMMECNKCGHTYKIGYENYKVGTACPSCDSNQSIKPHIVFFGGQAPNYKEMYEIFDNVDKDDLIIVIGTMGNVVNIQNIIKHKNCKKILCNMESSEYISERQFDKVFYESIETAMPKIKDYIESIGFVTK